MTVPFPLTTAGYSSTDFTGGEAWVLTATVPPGAYGEFFVEEGPAFYLAPVAYWCVQVEIQNIITFTPWVPMVQQTMLFPAPIGIPPGDTILRGTARPGVVLGATPVSP